MVEYCCKNNSKSGICFRSCFRNTKGATLKLFGHNNTDSHQTIIVFGVKIKLSKTKLRNQMMYKIIDKKLINPECKILVVAPHPDDEVIGCGGIIAKYKGQIDVLCINSSGVKYDHSDETAEKIAEGRIEEFYSVMKKANVQKSWIAKIWGVPPMFYDIEKNFNNYAEKFNFSDYDVIFIPHKYDGHREHRFVANHFMKKLLKKTRYKKDLKIARYEVWSAIQDPNYFEDITDFIQEKTDLINAYKSRLSSNYAKRTLGINYYRGLVAKCDYAEAYNVIGIKEFLKEKDDKSWAKPC